MRVAIRVDASVQIGTGHFMRCLTLADALKARGAEVCFVSRHLPDHLRAMLDARPHGFKLLETTTEDVELGKLDHSAWLGVSQARDAMDTLEALFGDGWDWLVVDHYALDIHWESVLRPVVGRIFVIDDIANRQHDCDLLLDQNVYPDKQSRYLGKVPEKCRQLLGPRYALLREEFSILRQHLSLRQGPVNRLLVFFGGMDVDDHTSLALQTLAKIGLPVMRVDVVIGIQHPARAQIEAMCLEHGYCCHVQTNRMAELMASADLSIGAGGATLWELCSLGLPTIAFATAENQLDQIRGAASEGLLYAPDSKPGFAQAIALHLPALLDNGELRSLVSRNGMQAVDGKGALRVASMMGCAGLVLRMARPEDSEAVFAWRNHLSIREVSRSPAPIPWDNHKVWFSEVLNNHNRLLLIAEMDAVPVGVVRFDIQDAKAEISLYLVPGQPGAASGRDLLQSAEAWLARNRLDVEILHAHVMGANGRSVGLFQRAGYGVESIFYVKKLNPI
ncbi:UDP-2,4-diacetamido-2,4,6-trideoxy-beta-L-altropyranose hydrolase [Methylobacillus sp. MM3]|uniref:UDP-2,4-diacetamido-2,4, 6-trideoxy-beta-L-altropyranose hydrolase n=1 Tax=Methylobacillus sp. MM3 TaxID=1848039 RepID=UPI0007E0C54C|nr:UDP-2,4-diacetamido-2,4,6-trideoxy-beta-L-altropyranose hydrolase [Methylobacillus sp. MM3]OAJ71372.1 UDP-2,4-diacetamido-2,4,6-trideoxy-beta-L-altropyranose hydrolase [Methylobacillus sp. MM3]